MADLIIMDRDALADLVKATELLIKLVPLKGDKVTDEENDRLMYINKLITTAKESFSKHNP